MFLDVLSANPNSEICLSYRMLFAAEGFSMIYFSSLSHLAHDLRHKERKAEKRREKESVVALPPGGKQQEKERKVISLDSN